jgi:hypothetical protein
MARAKVLTQRAAARGLDIQRPALFRLIAEGKLTRAELNGALAVQDDEKYQGMARRIARRNAAKAAADRAA